MKSYFVLVAMGIALAGCAKDDGPSKKGTGGTVGPQDLPTADGAGLFEAVKDDEMAVIRAGQCENGRQTQMETRLRAGQEFSYEDRWLDTNGEVSGNQPLRETIESVDFAGHVFTKKTFLDFSNGVHGWLKQSCRLEISSSQTSTSCQVTDVSPSLRSIFDNAQRESGPSSYMKSCSMGWERDSKPAGVSAEEWNAHHYKKYQVGTYRLKDGQRLAAFSERSETSGSITCYGRNDSTGEKVHGTRVTVRVSSKAIPNMGGISCGEAGLVFEYEALKDDNGRLLAFRKFELFGGKF